MKTLFIYILCFLITLLFAFFNWQGYHPISPDSEPARIIMNLTIWRNEPDVLRTFCAAKILSFGILGFIGCVSIVANMSLFIVVYTTWKIHRFLVQSTVHLTSRTIDIQNQFSRMIIIQTILPTIASATMMAINITGVTLKNYEGGLYLYLFVIYLTISACNPIITILCIKNYRTTVFFWQKSSVVSYQTSGNSLQQRTKTFSQLDLNSNSNSILFNSTNAT